MMQHIKITVANIKMNKTIRGKEMDKDARNKFQTKQQEDSLSTGNLSMTFLEADRNDI